MKRKPTRTETAVARGILWTTGVVYFAWLIWSIGWVICNPPNSPGADAASVATIATACVGVAFAFGSAVSVCLSSVIYWLVWAIGEAPQE